MFQIFLNFYLFDVTVRVPLQKIERRKRADNTRTVKSWFLYNSFVLSSLHIYSPSLKACKRYRYLKVRLSFNLQIGQHVSSKINKSGTCASASCHIEEHEYSLLPPPPTVNFLFHSLTQHFCLASSVGQRYTSVRKFKFDKSAFLAITLIKQASTYITASLTKIEKKQA